MKEDKFYHRVHDFVRREKKHIKICEHCKEEKKLDNALIHGKTHDKNVNNYISLCRKCHIKYDHPDGIKHSEETKIKIGIASSKRIKENGVHKNFINSKKGTKISEDHKRKISESMSGENHHQSKLTKDEAKFILNSTDEIKDLAIRFNVTKNTIKYIKLRKTWKNLD